MPLAFYNAAIFRELAILDHAIQLPEAVELGRHLNRFLKEYPKARRDSEWERFHSEHNVQYLEGLAAFWGDVILLAPGHVRPLGVYSAMDVSSLPRTRHRPGDATGALTDRSTECGAATLARVRASVVRRRMANGAAPR